KHAEIEEKQIQAATKLATLRKDNRENAEKMEQALADRSEAKGKLDDVRLVASQDDPQFADYERLVLDSAELAAEVTELAKQAKSARDYLYGLADSWDNWLKGAEVHGWPAEVANDKLASLRAPDTVAGLEAASALKEDFNQIYDTALERQRSQAPIIRSLEEKKSRVDGQLKLLKSNRTAAAPLLDKLHSLGIGAQTLGRVIEVLPEGEGWWGTMEAILGEDCQAVIVDNPADFAKAQRYWLGMSKPEPLIDPGVIATSTSSEGSLATLCEITHPLARRFVDWRFGHLVAVADRSELTAHVHAAARDGAVREGPMFRQMTPVKELTLGEKGLRRLRDAKQKEFEETKDELDKMVRIRDAVNRWLTEGKNAGLSRYDPPTSAAGLHRINELRPRLKSKEEAV